MARTYTENELLEPVRLARKVLSRVRLGKLDIDKATDTLVVLRPLSSQTDPFAASVARPTEGSPTDSSGSDTSDSDESSDSEAESSGRQSSPHSPEPAPKRHKQVLRPSPAGGGQEKWDNPSGLPLNSGPPTEAPKLGDLAWAMRLAAYKEQRGVYHAAVAEENMACIGEPFAPQRPGQETKTSFCCCALSLRKSARQVEHPPGSLTPHQPLRAMPWKTETWPGQQAYKSQIQQTAAAESAAPEAQQAKRPERGT